MALLDIAETLQSPLHFFFRVTVFVFSEQTGDFLFEHVRHELFWRCVAGLFGASLYLLEQLAVKLDTVSKHTFHSCHLHTELRARGTGHQRSRRPPASAPGTE